jgi:hypothetical protein
LPLRSVRSGIFIAIVAADTQAPEERNVTDVAPLELEIHRFLLCYKYATPLALISKQALKHRSEGSGDSAIGKLPGVSCRSVEI